MAIFRAFTPGRGGIIELSPASINAIESYIEWCENEVPSQVASKMDVLVNMMALVNQSIARKMSFGPYDPTGMKTDLAWRTPDQGIRRITQNYYLGWKVRKLGFGDYLLYNSSREAYYIEFGISQVGFGGTRSVPRRRIRRPVSKLSVDQDAPVHGGDFGISPDLG